MNKEEKLYDITLPLDEQRKALYFLGGDFSVKNRKIIINNGETVDFGTYFNSFSVKKWLKYSTIENVAIRIQFAGVAEIHCYGLTKKGSVSLETVQKERGWVREFDAHELCDAGVEILAFSIKAIDGDCEILKAAYYGTFEEIRNVKVGITICTFHREEYLLRNLDKLEEVCLKNKDFSVLVVDNGSTLTEREGGGWLRILHNPNYGGSGGFTRGLIEQVSKGKNTHIVLMDDDILFEPSVFERLLSLLKHVRSERQGQMVSGAMLDMDNPLIQYENTAFWGGIRLHRLGNDIDLSRKENLVQNENYSGRKNQYGAWWFCCIPVETVKTIGYPLPVFIKGDDMEYGIRNAKPLMTLNGIGVWHEKFEKKMNPVVNYFSDRNMLILNHYVESAGRWTFLVSAIGRLARRIFRGDFEGIKMLELALRDVGAGFEGITEIPADKKLQLVKQYQANQKNILKSIIDTGFMIVQQFVRYRDLNVRYRRFRDIELSNEKFWRSYLKLDS